jgi:hypothetical protein
MTNPTDQEVIREFVDRPRRYLNAGGLLELFWGLWMLGASLLVVVGRSAPRAWHGAFVIGLVAWPALVGIGMRVVRRSVIYRRTGSVQYRRPPLKPREYLLAGAAIAGFAFLSAWYGGSFLVPAVIATFLPAMYAALSRLDRIWKWAILVAMAASPLVLRWASPMAWIGLLGLLWTISGAPTFWLYLRGSRALKEDKE